MIANSPLSSCLFTVFFLTIRILSFTLVSREGSSFEAPDADFPFQCQQATDTGLTADFCPVPFQALDGITPPEVHHPLDLLLLLQLHDTAPARQRLVEAVLKKKVRSRVFTREVLQQTFTAHAQVRFGACAGEIRRMHSSTT